MSPITVIVILLVVAAFLVLGLLLYVNWKLKKEAKDNVLCFFITDTGMYERMLPAKDGYVLPPEDHLPFLKKGKAPKSAYRLPEKKIYTQWPTWGWPMAFRVEVRCALYREGNFRPIEWAEGTINDASANLLAAAIWDKSLADILGKVGAPDIVSEGGIKPMYMWLGFGVMALLIVIFGIVTWLTYSNLGNLMSLWGM